MEDFELCEKAQENLERGIYGEGILNPVKENGVAFYQQRVRGLVRAEWEGIKRERERAEMNEKRKGFGVEVQEVGVVGQ